MTPTDAMATAKLLSGAEATAMADQAREEQTGSGEGMIPPSGSPGDSPPESMAGEGPNQPSPGNAAMPPTPGTGERPQMPGPNTGLVSEQAAQGATNDPQAQLADSSHDASFQQDPNQRRPWSASLPPEIRDSMQSTSKQPLPTYYENQLKAYFQSFNP